VFSRFSKLSETQEAASCDTCVPLRVTLFFQVLPLCLVHRRRHTPPPDWQPTHATPGRLHASSSFKYFTFALFTDGATLPLPIGNQRTPHQEDYMRVAFREFDQASPENMCKFDATEPTPGNFSWTDCDLIGNLSSSPLAMNGTCVTSTLATAPVLCHCTHLAMYFHLTAISLAICLHRPSP
jgi:hypothetical protein